VMVDTPAPNDHLGFALLLRERKAMLRLEHRALDSGLDLSDYEAQIPDVTLPLGGSVSASLFRHRRCRAEHLTLTISCEASNAWLAQAVVGRELEGLCVHRASVNIEHGKPILRLEGRGSTGEWWALVVRLELIPRGRLLQVRPRARWLLCVSPIEGAKVWRRFVETLPWPQEGAESFVVDPARHALTRAFVSAGWKAPDLEELAIHAIEFEPTGCRLRLQAGPAPKPVDPEGDELILAAITQEVDDLRHELARHGPTSATVDRLERLTTAVPDLALLEDSASMWFVDTIRHAGPLVPERDERCFRMLERLSATRPGDPLVHRWCAEMLLRTRRFAQLADQMRARRTTLQDAPWARRVAFDVGLARLESDKLAEREHARGLLTPWVERVDQGESFSPPVRVAIGSAMAIALVATSAKARSRLERTLEGVTDPEGRAAERVALANALIEVGSGEDALPVLWAAASESDDPVIFEAASRAATLCAPEGPDAEDSPTSRLARQLALRAVSRAHPRGPDLTRWALEMSPLDVELKKHAAAFAAAQGDEASRRARESAETLEQVLLWLDQKLGDRAIDGARLLFPDLEVAEQRALLTRALDRLDGTELEGWIGLLRQSLPPGEGLRLIERVADKRPLTLAEQRLRVESLATLGQQAEALSLCHAEAEASEGDVRADWLLRAAALSEPEQTPYLLLEAHALRPDDPELEERLLGVLTVPALRAERERILEQRARHPRRSVDQRCRALDSLIQARRPEPVSTKAMLADPELLDLYRLRLDLRDDDIDGLLLVARDDERRNQQGEAERRWGRALELLAADDRRGLTPALAIAHSALGRGDGTVARRWLEHVVHLEPTHLRAWSMLAHTAELVEDDALRLRAFEAGFNLSTTEASSERGALGIEIARLHDRGGRPEAAAMALARASKAVQPGSARHQQIARAWLALARDRSMEVRHEAEARAEMRLALGDAIAPEDIADEAWLLANRMAQPGQAIALVEHHLAGKPSHPLWLSTLKQIALLHGAAQHYFDALDRAIEPLPRGESRDELLLEFVATAAELDDPTRILTALDRLTREGASKEDALDLHQWAVQRLGIEAEELRSAGDALLANPEDALISARLQRLLGGPQRFAEHLLDLAERPGAGPNHASLLRQAFDASVVARDHGLLIRGLRRAIAAKCDFDVAPYWDAAVRHCRESKDDAQLTELLLLARRRGPQEPELRLRVEPLVRDALADNPSSTPLHRLLWAQSRGRERRVTTVTVWLQAFAADRGLRGATLASLYIAQSDQFDDGAVAAEFLVERAERLAEDAEAFEGLTDALVARGHFTDAVRLLESQASNTTNPDIKVSVLKRLATIHADMLGEVASAANYLEQAIVHSPNDLTLLLPVIRASLSRNDVDRCIPLLERALASPEAGPRDLMQLTNRAADLAVNQGDVEAATSLLRLARDRDPDHRETQTRLAELEADRRDPEYHAKQLARVAATHSGESRLEALEQRASLLIDSLARPEDAIADLETVVSEDPRRDRAWATLRELYSGAGRWRELVSLLGRLAQRQVGMERCQTLLEMADVYRRELDDLVGAEQALRTALHGLDEDPESRDLAETVRRALVTNLQAQGRYVDLATYLEAVLAAELEGHVETTRLAPRRAELMIELARLYRGPLDNEAKAARVYERLEQLGRLPEEGLATLARVYRRDGRNVDLVRILDVRSRELGEAGETERKASVDLRIAELLDGPLGRPHAAVRYYIEAYLGNPAGQAAAGTRARALLTETDDLANERRKLIARLRTLPNAQRPALLTLLGDVLVGHEEYQDEAEMRYRESLSIEPSYSPALQSLGRMMARRGRAEDAVGPLSAAVHAEDLDPADVAENATIAAAALLELERPKEAEGLLRHALERAPDSHRGWVELARVYERLGRTRDEASALERAAELPLPEPLLAQVAYRRVVLILPTVREDPFSPEAERARIHLVEAVHADRKHVGARDLLLELSTQRLEWSTVIQMLELRLNEPLSPRDRALVHLGLAETFALHLGNIERTVEHLEGAALGAPDDPAVTERWARLGETMPNAAEAATRVEALAGEGTNLLPAARAWMKSVAAVLYARAGDTAAAQAAAQAVLLDPQGVPTAAASLAERTHAALAEDARRELGVEQFDLLERLETEDSARERLSVLRRLQEIGQSLGDWALVEKTSREQIDLGARNGASEDDLSAAVAALRQVYASRKDHEKLIALLDEGAERTSSIQDKTTAWVEAGRLTWETLGDATRSVAFVERALGLNPAWVPALELLGEVARGTRDRAAEEKAFRRLSAIDTSDRSMATTLELARLAGALGQKSEAVAWLRPLVDQSEDVEIRFAALRELNERLAGWGTPAEREPVLRQYLDEAIARESDDAPDVACELVRVESALGLNQEAMQTLRAALETYPTHRGLLQIEVQRLEVAQDWSGLALSLESLAARTVERIERAKLFVRAARIRLDHQSAQGDAKERRQAVTEARRLLMLACDTAPTLALPRAQLLPLSFSEARWDEVLDLAQALRELGGEDEDVLILAALTEAYRRGDLSLARDVSYRHEDDARAHFLYPGLRQLLTEVATRGPMTKLDVLLEAGAALAGGRTRLSQGLKEWASGRPVQVGVTLGLARLSESEGHADLARSLYQITAFLAQNGPVPALAARLPVLEPKSDAFDASWRGPSTARGLRQALYRLRDAWTGVAPDEGQTRGEVNDERLRMAETIVQPWRNVLGVRLPVTWTESGLPGGVGAISRTPPTLVLGRGCELLPAAEFRFRLAMATAAIAMGLVVLDDPHLDLGSMLDALYKLCAPEHEPTELSAVWVARIEATLRAGATLLAEEREALLEDLGKRETTDVPGLRTQLNRARLLFASQLSGQLDGALLALGRDQGVMQDGRLDPVATLRTKDAHWLLRAMGLY